MADEALKFLADQLAKGLEETKKLVQSLQTEVHAAAITQTHLKVSVDNMQSTLESLNKIIREGNGEKSLIARIMTLENFKKEAEKQLEEERSRKKSTEIEDKKGKWQLKTAVLTGSVSVIIAILSAVVSFVK